MMTTTFSLRMVTRSTRINRWRLTRAFPDTPSTRPELASRSPLTRSEPGAQPHEPNDILQKSHPALHRLRLRDNTDHPKHHRVREPLHRAPQGTSGELKRDDPHHFKAGKRRRNARWETHFR